MKVVLVLVSVFFTKALALECYDCVARSPHTCTTHWDCPYDCNNLAATLTVGGVHMEHSTSACLPSVFCVTGRINAGFLKASVNSRCCKTDLCNDQVLPALPTQAPNGKTCCSNNDCSETVKCNGDEDRCINGSAHSFIADIAKTGVTPLCVRRPKWHS
ncbi:hypothetical protein AOLI_G00154790 [Acnodon oligacanthus]